MAQRVTERWAVEQEYGDASRWHVVRVPDGGVLDSFSGPEAKAKALALATRLNRGAVCPACGSADVAVDDVIVGFIDCNACGVATKKEG